MGCDATLGTVEPVLVTDQTQIQDLLHDHGNQRFIEEEDLTDVRVVRRRNCPSYSWRTN